MPLFFFSSSSNIRYESRSSTPAILRRRSCIYYMLDIGRWYNVGSWVLNGECWMMNDECWLVKTEVDVTETISDRLIRLTMRMRSIQHVTKDGQSLHSIPFSEIRM